ncbi:MAG: nuclear transport factor 2 family protein, partial [Gluconacetobacter diazotrophicus]|nr:nuclear transport factor 2 family protein [Gluconacetobacter diazotrophicus]
AVGRHHRAADGAPITIDYVSVITRDRDGVTLYRDYMNPLQLAAI